MIKGFFRLLAMFFEVGMVLFYIVGLFLLFKTFKYAETEGVVTSIGSRTTYLNFKTDYLVIDYNVKGEEYTYYRDTNLKNNKKIGDSYKILYDKTNPNIMRADYHIILFFELGTFCLIMLLFCSYFARERYE